MLVQLRYGYCQVGLVSNISFQDGADLGVGDRTQ